MSRRSVATLLGLVVAACGGEDAGAPDLFAGLYQGRLGEFRQISSFDTTGGNRDRLEIAAGDSAVLLDVAGPGVIQRVWITVSSSDPDYLRRIALEMYWDGETEPSVAVPLGDFFGNGFDKRHYTALPMGVSSGGFYSYLPMPYRQRARIVAVNGTGRPIDAFYYNIGLTALDALPRDVRTFHAWWHRDPRTADTLPHLVLDAHGRGVLAGVSLNAESYNGRLWFLEGDEAYVVDRTFRGRGTGTEDYFNGGWYFDQGPFAGPFHGVVVKDEGRGRIAAYRWHIPDPVPFHSSLRMTLEHGHGNEELADYATVAYWYQTEPHAPLPPLPPPDERRVLRVKIPPEAVMGSALRVTPGAAELRVAAPVPRADRYEVVVYPSATADTTILALPGATRRMVPPSDEDPGTVLPAITLGVVPLAREVVVEVAGRAPQPPAALEVRPVRQWAAVWNVVGPFPNPQVIGSETSPALDSVYGPERDPALGAAYGGVGGRRVRWHRVEAGPNGQIRLNPEFTPNDWVTAYAQAWLRSPDARDALLLLGADDAHVLWVNGARVSERQGRHISQPDEIEVPVRLEPGWNRILLEVADLDGGWAFQLRAADPDGVLRWSPVPREETAGREDT
jgi:hypothetical protein